MSKLKMHRVLMVCLGNICRSPLAEGVLKKRAEERGLLEQFEIDSAGTANYHVDELADPRSRRVALQNGFELTHRVRQFKRDDFSRFDHIFVMDQSNLKNVSALAESAEDRAKVRILAELDPVQKYGPIVKDPYYDEIEAFHELYDHLVVCIDHFLESL